MSFTLGRPILVMCCVAIVTGVAVSSRRQAGDAELNVWVFSAEHRDVYAPIVERFGRERRISVALRLTNTTGIDHRLQSDFTDGIHTPGSPDVVEVEIGSVGKFFRPPIGEVGFEPLKPYLRASGLYERVLASRFAPWTKAGVIYGVPHDVHPVGIVYRDDLFREAGIDLSTTTTWPAFRQACEQFQQYWRAHGQPTRHALELSRSRPDEVTMMLLQRGINLVDDYDRVHLANAKAAATFAFCARCAAGSRAIGSASAGGDGPFAQDLQAGNLCAFFAADWRLANLKQLGGDALRGKLRLMPLPRFDPTDAPTATHGGTMIGIPKSSPRKAEAWQLIEQLYFSPEALRRQREVTHILPAQPAAWDDPAYHQGDDYFGGQHVDELLIELARQIPRRYVTPATLIAGHYVVQVLARATAYVDEHGEDDPRLEGLCQQWLDEAAADLASRIKFASFDAGR